jgi:hypothetical protein
MTAAHYGWHNRRVGKPRNVAREIIVSLVAGAVFAVGLYAYIKSSMPVVTASQLVTPGTAAREPDDLQLASAAAGRFISALHAEQYADAYALMAAPYRERFSAAEFRAQCRVSEFLAHGDHVSLSRTRRSVPPGVDPTRTSLQAEGALVYGERSVEVRFTFVTETADELKILVFALAGSPILDGVAAGATSSHRK